tara:strand:+ start:593 stop:1726 length:1134 start_codon:yes stop_codon:yes gene_type:complete
MAVSRINEAGLNVNQYGNRRLNINGAMQVAQRGAARTVSDGGAEGYQTLDRWYALFSSSAGGVATISQDTTVPSGYGFGSSYKVDVATADTSIAADHAITIQYRFEAQDIVNSGWDYTNSNSNMSVSFWARSVKAGTYCVFFYTGDGTLKSLVQEYTLEADTWKYVTLRFKGDSGISFNNDNGLGLTVGWTLVAGTDRYQSVTAGTWIDKTSGNGQARYATSNQVNFFDNTANNFFLTGVQIEVGDTATDFEHRSYGDELQRCFRYYYRMSCDGTHDGVYSIGNAYTTDDAVAAISLPVAMRTEPTLGYQTGSTGHRIRTGAGQSQQTSSLSISSFDNTNFTNLGFHGVTTTTNLTIGQAAQFRLSVNDFIDFDSEL